MKIHSLRNTKRFDSCKLLPEICMGQDENGHVHIGLIWRPNLAKTTIKWLIK